MSKQPNLKTAPHLGLPSVPRGRHWSRGSASPYDCIETEGSKLNNQWRGVVRKSIVVHCFFGRFFCAFENSTRQTKHNSTGERKSQCLTLLVLLRDLH